MTILASATAAYAMRVSPMVLEMETRGANSVARVEVQNLNPGKLAFETRITRLTFEDNGNIVETPADEDFLVFPPQGVLPTSARQVIRLQWVGAPDIAQSQAYYVSVNQLPVPIDGAAEGENRAQVQIVYHMKALVVVSPPGATPNVEAESAQAAAFQPPAPSEGAALPPTVPGVEISLRNTGRRHAMMSAFGWRLQGNDPEGRPMRLEVTAEELNRLVGTGYVPALGRRTFRFPVPEAFGPGPIRVSFVQ